MTDESPQQNVVQRAWDEFHSSIKNAMDTTTLDEGAVSFSRASFYFGSLAMLEIVQTMLEQVSGNKARDEALAGLRSEIEAFIEQQGAETREH